LIRSAASAFFNQQYSRHQVGCQTQLIKMLCLRCSRGMSAITSTSIVVRTAGKPALKPSAKRYIAPLLKSIYIVNCSQNFHIPPWTLSADNISILRCFQTISWHSLISNFPASKRRWRIRSPTKDIITPGLRSNTNTLWTSEYI
jgi:hypothetical protein